MKRVKSKVIITLPKDVETVELLEKSSDYISKKEDIVQQLRNLYGEKGEQKKETNFDVQINKFMEREG